MSSINGYEKKCHGCKLSQKKWPEPGRQPESDELPKPPLGGMIIEIKREGQEKANWIINHYGGTEGFLGWLSLQPKCHKMQLSELTNDELLDLGVIIREIDKVLQEYWKDNFPQDPIKRVYLVYFFESVFDSKPTDYHLHIHLIPRTKAMDILLREDVEGDNSTSINAWKISRLTKDRLREIDSLGYSKDNEEAVKKLMEFLNEKLIGVLRK